MGVNWSDEIGAAVRRAAAARRSAAVGEALTAVDPGAIAGVLHSRAAGSGTEPLASGIPASPGAVTGRIACSADDAMAMADAGDAVILVRTATGPADVLGMRAARGILTSRGGATSHAAVIARGWGIPAVVGVADMQVEASTVTIGSTTLHAGDEITIDGTSGTVYAGRVPTGAAPWPAGLGTLLRWADAVRSGHVELRANADTVDDAMEARRLGAGGIGLCRTEHMFLGADRLPLLRRFVLAADPGSEAVALVALEAAQTADFLALLRAMDGLPVTVRLLDAPLHEFLPDLVDLTAREAVGDLSERERAEVAAAHRLHEVNPMMGTRGVRLAILRPGLYEMQVRALCRAAAELREAGKNPRVEIMVPFVVDPEELRLVRRSVARVLSELECPALGADAITVGAMVETPRAALTAGALAEHADFLSFGTNDLTQMTHAFSRDDVEARLLPAYLAQGIVSANPFVELDRVGVGAMIRTACDAARAVKPAIRLGVCGEHAGDPASLEFLVGLGVDLVSCSPRRLPVARLAVAQALLTCQRARIEDVAFDFGPEGWGDVPAAEPAVSDVALDEAMVLHVLRVRGLARLEGLVASLGADPVPILGRLVEEGLVRRDDARDVYALLPDGRRRHEQWLAERRPETMRERLGPDYARFLALNSEFKQLCHDWQVRDGQPNDHADPAHDRACIKRLAWICAEAGPILASMATVLPRLVRYRARLEGAAQAVLAGDTGRFTGLLCESFHDIWMELHEDLIVLQGIDRATEGSS